MKTKVVKLLSYLLIISMFCGVLITPQAYKADEDLEYHLGYNTTSYYFVEQNGVYSSIGFSGENYATNVPPYITHVRILYKLGFDIQVNDVLHFVFNFNLSGGTLDHINIWTGIPQSNMFATNVKTSTSDTLTQVGGSFVGNVKVAEDSEYLWIDMFYTRSSQTLYQPLLLSECTVVRESSLDDVVEGTTSIFDAIVNLPSAICSALGSAFSNAVSLLPDNIEIKLRGHLTDIINDLSDLPGAIQDALSGNFTTLGSTLGATFSDAFSLLPDKIEGGLRDHFTNMISGIKAIPDNMGSFFSDLGDGLFELSEEDQAALDYWNDKSSSGALPDDIVDSYNEIQNGVNSSTAIDVDTIVNGESKTFISSLFDIIFSFPHVETCLIATFSFAFLAFVFFGKR